MDALQRTAAPEHPPERGRIREIYRFDVYGPEARAALEHAGGLHTAIGEEISLETHCLQILHPIEQLIQPVGPPVPDSLPVLFFKGQMDDAPALVQPRAIVALCLVIAISDADRI